MREGFYAIYYTGLTGSGFGLIVLSAGIITGVDCAGGTYDGHYESLSDQSQLTGNLTLSVPAGTPLVTGVPESLDSWALNFPLDLPENFASGVITLVDTTAGPVNVIFKKLRDLAKSP